METLESNRGSLTDSQLLELLKKSNSNLSNQAFNKVLLRLELGGMIHVSTLTKNSRRIELVPQSEDD